MKRLTMLCWPALAALAMATVASGCTEDSSKDDGGDKFVPGSQVDISADTNRDGYVDINDNEGEDVWSVAHGAAFLPNLDSDAWNPGRDADDGIVNITPEYQGDRYDLSPVVVAPWPDAPDGASATVTLDDLSIKHVRIFKLLADDNYELVAGSDGPCGAGGDGNCPYWNGVVQLTGAELRAGVQLAVEGRRLVGLPDSVSVDPATQQEVPWSGVITLSYVVHDDDGSVVSGKGNPDGVDVLQMRVAPWIMFGNLSSKIDTIFAEETNSSGSPEFVSGLKAATESDGMESLKNTFCFNCFWGIGNWPDQWVEDWMQTGFVSIPLADGAVHGMRLTMPRPWGRSNQDKDLPVNWLMENHVHPDRGTFVVYKKAHSGDSYDSHGNHDLIPAYSNNGAEYPYGRIIHGSGILNETKAFYEAQLVQAPALTVKTSWLIVGHVDEVFSYVPANTERGWKLMVGSPRLARTMMEQWQADGHGGQLMFQGRQWSDGSPAQVTIDETLADANIMAWSQEAQAEIDGMLDQMKSEIGLTDDEIVEIPYLFEEDFGAKVAYNPGTVNSLVFNGNIVIPEPFGPSINGVDGFKQDLMDRLGTSAEGLGADGNGLKVFFADDWNLYHRLLGEVHCGTNQEGPPLADVKWWGAMQ